MNRYNDYVPSESYWLSEVPSHWKKTKNKFILFSEKSEVGNNWEEYDLLTMGKRGVRTRDMEGGGKFPASFENYQTVKPNQIVFCLFDLDETPRTVGISSQFGMITSAYDVFSCTNETDPRFVNYFYQSIDDVKGLKPYYTGLRKVVRPDTFMGITFYSPPLSEQKEISNYLDKKLSQIDLLIEKTERKIELLKEQKTATINHYVTKGLDPTVKMKDSGIEWIGEIPEHWSIKRIKNLGSIRSGDGITNSDLVDDGIYPVYGGNGIIGSFTHSNVRETVIVIGRVGEKCGNVHLVDEESWISDNALILEIYQKNTLPWLHLSLMTRDLNKLRNQSSQPLITGTQVKNESIPYPPIDEMIKLCHKINQKSLPLLKTIDVEFKRIELLKEYRQTLISNVVTGKVRVTEEVI